MLIILLLTLNISSPVSASETAPYASAYEGRIAHDSPVVSDSDIQSTQDLSVPSDPDIQSTQDHSVPSDPDIQSTQDHSVPSDSDIQSTQDHSAPSDSDIQSKQDHSVPSDSDIQSTQDHSVPSDPNIQSTQDYSVPSDPDIQSTQDPALFDETDSFSDTSPAEELTLGSAGYTYINVTWPEFGANGGDYADDTSALNSALYAAATSAAQYGRTIEVYVPAGTYYINNVLLIYSDTWLHLDSKATITRTDQTKEMLAGIHRDRNNHVCYYGCTHTGYTQVVNTKVTGGRWNGGMGSGSCGGPVYSRDILTFRHCSDITIADTIIGDDCAIHSVNIDGVRNLTVSNVTFQNHYRYTGTEGGYYGGNYIPPYSYGNYWTREALHIDEINYDNYSTAYPLEVLPCMNINVTGCTFRNVVSGLGTHNYSRSNPSVNITIRGNTFNTVFYQCIHAFNFKDLTVIDNKAYNVTGFIYGKDCSTRSKEYSYIQNNTVECGKISGYPVQDTIYLVGENKVFIENNTFRNIQAACINLNDGASYKTDTAFSEAVINLNLMENAAGLACENRNYSAVMVGNGCKINMWKNRMHLQEYPGGSHEVHGVLLNNAAGGSILSKNIIHGGDVGIYLKETHDASVYSNEIKWTKRFGSYCVRSNKIEMTGNLFMSNSACGILLEDCNNVKTWRNSALWNGTKDLWLIRCSRVDGLNSFNANSFDSKDSSQVCQKYIQGDINFDGYLSVQDLQLLSRYVANPDAALRSESYMGDINVDGKLSYDDVNVMSRRIVN